jgi:hypothetical protein
MKNFINSLNKIEKILLSALLVWTCICLFFLSIGISTNVYIRPVEYIFLIHTHRIAAFDISEFILYVVTPWVAFVSYKLLWK